MSCLFLWLWLFKFKFNDCCLEHNEPGPKYNEYHGPKGIEPRDHRGVAQLWCFFCKVFGLAGWPLVWAWFSCLEPQLIYPLFADCLSLPKAKDYTFQTAKVWHELKDPPKKLGLCEDKTTGTGLSQPIRFCVWVWILILVGHDMIWHQSPGHSHSGERLEEADRGGCSQRNEGYELCVQGLLLQLCLLWASSITKQVVCLGRWCEAGQAATWPTPMGRVDGGLLCGL